MANLYSGTHSFTGYKTLAELTGLTFEADKKYMVQVISVAIHYYVREGATGKGFVCATSNPFEWTYNGDDDLYIGNEVEKSITINVSD